MIIQEQINDATTGSTETFLQRIIASAHATETNFFHNSELQNAIQDQNLRNIIVNQYDTSYWLSSFMDALIYVAGFETKDQVDTIYDVYQSLILQNSNQNSKANSPQYRLILSRAKDEYDNLIAKYQVFTGN